MAADDRVLNDGSLSSLGALHRSILNFLINTSSGRASFSDLVDYVVEEESHSAVPNRETIAITLHHVHLPKLVDKGLVDIDRQYGSIAATDRTRQIEVEMPDEVAGVQPTLSHRYSRAVCRYFRLYSTEVASLADLVHFICEHDGQATDEKAVEIHLYHSILPKLADAGFVDYDPHREIVRYLEPESVEGWLDQVAEAGGVPL